MTNKDKVFTMLGFPIKPASNPVIEIIKTTKTRKKVKKGKQNA